MKRNIRSNADKLWYGAPGIRMIWHGEWNDPELEADGYVANYWDVEQYMYDNANEDGIDAENDDEFGQYVRDHADDAKWFISEIGTKDGDDDYIDSGCHGKSKKKKRPVKSSMPGRERGIQAIMDEYGCTREEAIEIMNEDIQSSRRTIKSSMVPDVSDEDLKFFANIASMALDDIYDLYDRDDDTLLRHGYSAEDLARAQDIASVIWNMVI